MPFPAPSSLRSVFGATPSSRFASRAQRPTPNIFGTGSWAARSTMSTSLTFPIYSRCSTREETEDLVFLYLQSRGWYVVPNSRKGNTLRFEFMLAHSQTGDKALTQVKTGDVRLNIDAYADHHWHIFLFQSKGHYDGRKFGKRPPASCETSSRPSSRSTFNCCRSPSGQSSKWWPDGSLQSEAHRAFEMHGVVVGNMRRL